MAALAIINPAAGGGRCRGLAPAALARLRGAGIAIDSKETAAPGDAARFAAEAYARGVRRFVAVGGDGTAYEILNGLFPQASAAHDRRVTLGFLPLGTGNSFLRDFTDHGAEDALQAIVEDRHRPCDVVRLEHDQGELFYINLLSLGFVADVCSTANRRFKRFGVASYALAVMLQTARLSPQPIRFRLDGGPWVEQEAIFVSLCNSRFTGGT
jgi:diacylglycerol kinase family enzyme